MALWKARGRGSLNKNLEFRSWHCGRQGGGRKWVGWEAQVSIGGASDRFEAQVIRRRNLLKNFSSRVKPFSSTFRTLLKPPSNLSEALWSFCEAPTKLPWSPLHLETLSRPSQAPEALLKPPWSPSQAPFKPPSKTSPSSPLQALLKPPWSPLKALLKPPWSPPWSPLEAPLKPFSSPLEAPLQALEGFTKVKPPSSPLQAPLRRASSPLEAPPSSPPSSLLKVKGTVRFSLRILPDLATARNTKLFFLPAPVAFRRVTTWGLPADQRGIEPPPAVCPRRQEQRPTNWATGTPATARNTKLLHCANKSKFGFV